MESVKENDSSAPQGTSDTGGNPAKPSGSSQPPPGKRPSIGEDEAGGAEAKLFGKGLAATSLLQIAIRNGIYQNQVANAGGGPGKGGNVYSLPSASSSASVNSLLSRRRHKHKRNLSLGAPPTAGSSVVEAAGPAPSASPLSTLSLDRKTFLRQKQLKQLQASDRSWVRSDLRRGCIHVHDWLTPSYPRPVLCTADTTAREVASKLQGSKAGAVLRINCKPNTADPNELCHKDSNGLTDDPKPEENEQCHKVPSNLLLDQAGSNSSSEICLNDIGIDLSQTDGYGGYSGSDVESSTCEDFSPGAPRSSENQDSLSEGLVLSIDSSAMSSNCDSATEGPDPFESSSDELELNSSPLHSTDTSAADLLPSDALAASSHVTRQDGEAADTPDAPTLIKHLSKCSSSSQTRPLTSQASVQEIPGGGRGWPEPINPSPTPALFIQLHGGAVRRLGDDERPLQILNEYLTNLGFEEAWRVQEESMNPEIGCLIRFYFGEHFVEVVLKSDPQFSPRGPVVEL